jgi:hypothetical protein
LAVADIGYRIFWRQNASTIHKHTNTLLPVVNLPLDPIERKNGVLFSTLVLVRDFFFFFFFFFFVLASGEEDDFEDDDDDLPLPSPPPGREKEKNKSVEENTATTPSSIDSGSER